MEDRQDLIDKLRPFSIPTLVLAHSNLDRIFESLLKFGKRLGREKRATDLVKKLKAELEEIKSGLSTAPKKRVLFLVGRNTGTLTDLYAVGGSSYIGQLVELAGGINIFNNLRAIYPKVSIEEVMIRDPEVIIDLSHGDGSIQGGVQQINMLWSRFPNISAVEDDKVHVVTDDVFLVPGPRVSIAVKQLAELIHGDALF
jgi:iron complex transport system substrate-binding protein